MATTVDCCPTQLIDSDGGFKDKNLDKFIESSNMDSWGISYAVVAIIGPQSSGKSTLMNHLFGTNFKEMNPKKISQTTEGIWIAKCNGIEPSTIVMDIEGTDGRERGEDNTIFQKQSALFAFAVSDVVLINRGYLDIGRVQAADKPLLETVFKAMMGSFSDKKTKLLFVIRDKPKIMQLDELEPILREDIQKIWDSVPKPEAHVHTPLSEFFNVKVTALSNYEHQNETFKKEVDQLRRYINDSIAPNGRASAVVPASGFSKSAQEIWNVIRDNKDLDLPAHKILVANFFCQKTVTEMHDLLRSDKDWEELLIDVEKGPVIKFREKLEKIIDTCLDKYDEKTIFYDEDVRNAKRKQLESKALETVYPAYETMIGHLGSNALGEFKTKLDQALNNGEGFASSVQTLTQSILHEFDEGSDDASIRQVKFDASKVRENLLRNINSHALAVRDTKLLEIKANYEKQLETALADVKSFFETSEKDPWFSIRNFLKSETTAAVLKLSDCVADFKLENETLETMKQSLGDHAKTLVEKSAREVAKEVVSLMKDRFSIEFNFDKKLLPRVWTKKLNIEDIKKDAQKESLKLLSDMAAIRLDEDKPDTIEKLLSSLLINKTSAETTSRDSLNSSTWAEVSHGDILISPLKCKVFWKEFNDNIKETVIAAVVAQTASKKETSKCLPYVAPALQVLTLGAGTAGLILGIEAQKDHNHHDDPNGTQ